jgi:hypothetical protein
VEGEPQGDGCAFIVSVIVIGIGLVFVIAVWLRMAGR